MIPSLLSRRRFLFGAAASGLNPLPLTRLASAEGTPFANGMLDIFLTGTATPAPAYTDAALTHRLSNPVEADRDGRLPSIFLDPAITYRLRARTRWGAAIEGMDFDPVPGSRDAQATFRQDDRHAVTRLTAAKLGDFVNVLDFHEAAAGDDITQALELVAYEALPHLQAIGAYLPAGRFRVTRQIMPARQFSLRGAGMSATILDFHDVAVVNRMMKGAFSFGLLETCRAYDPDIAGKVAGTDIPQGINGSDSSTIENLAIKISGARSPRLDYGVWSAAKIFCRDVVALGCGFKWCASELQSMRGSIVGNANLSLFSNCHSLSASEHGFMADGTDANACKIIGCNAFLPTKIGFFDASFLGNTYEACHAAGGVSGYTSIAPAGSNRSVFDGCYCEPDAGDKWNVASPGVILNPKGVMPDTQIVGLNITMAPMHQAGYATGSAIDFVRDLDPYTFGSGQVPAARAFPGGFVVRGQGDGGLYEFVSSGQQWGGGQAIGPGAGIVKRDGSTGIDYNLVWFGDPRHRPAFPLGMIASLPGPYADNAAARAAGLTAGEFYRQIATNLVAVVV